MILKPDTPAIPTLGAVTVLLVITARRSQAGRLNLPRYFITWSGHVQACVQDWPSCNRGVFPAVDHDRSRT